MPRRMRLLGVVFFSLWVIVAAMAQGGAVSNAPYRMERKTTSVQTLADGTKITQVTTEIEARDSAGRTLRQTHVDAGNGAEANDMVFDPVAGTFTSWAKRGEGSGGAKVATRTHSPATGGPQVALSQGPGPESGCMGGGIGSSMVVARVVASSSTGERPRQQVEKLPGKTIAGVYAEGTRTTITYAVGSIGNDRPVVWVWERWYSPDLKVELTSMNDDPRSGVRMTEVVSLDRGEPDARLFQVPEGYEVREVNPAGH